MINTIANKAPLTQDEQEALKKAITGWGKLKTASTSAGMNPGTIRRAAYGFDLLPENLTKIRAFLNPQTAQSL